MAFTPTKKDNPMNQEKRLTKSPDKWIAGVCGGLAEYIGFDKDLVRILWLLLTFLTVAFPGVVAYLILWVLMPKR